MRFNSVDLPAPLGPTMPIRSPERDACVCVCARAVQKFQSQAFNQACVHTQEMCLDLLNAFFQHQVCNTATKRTRYKIVREVPDDLFAVVLDTHVLHLHNLVACRGVEDKKARFGQRAVRF